VAESLLVAVCGSWFCVRHL